MAELSLPGPAQHRRGGAAYPSGTRQAGRADRDFGVGWAYRRRHPQRSAGDAEPRGVGRSKRRARSLSPAQVPPLRPLLLVSGPEARGGGRRSSGQSPPARRRSFGATGAGQLGGSGGASSVSPIGAGRSAPP